LVTDSNYLIEFCQSFCKILEKFAKYIVVSGFLVICSGRSRGTEDIDIIMEVIDYETFVKMYEDLRKNHFSCIQTSDPHEIYHKYLIEKIPVRFIKNRDFIPNIELPLNCSLYPPLHVQTDSCAYGGYYRNITISGDDIWLGRCEKAPSL